MEKEKVNMRKKLIKGAIGLAVGVLLGFIYYRVVGCGTGTCPITSSPINTMVYGGISGFLIGFL